MLSREEVKKGIIDLVTSANNYWAICAKTGHMSLMISPTSLQTLTQLDIKFDLVNSECSIPGFPHEVKLTVDQYDLLADKSESYD